MCEGAANPAQHLSRRERADPGLGIGQQLIQSRALMGVGDHSLPCPPEPLDAVAVGSISGRVDEAPVKRRWDPGSASSARTSRELRLRARPHFKNVELRNVCFPGFGWLADDLIANAAVADSTALEIE